MIDEELERDVLALSLRDVGFARKASPVLKDVDFTSRPRKWIWARLRKAVRENGEVPTPAQWAAFSAKDFSKPDAQAVAKKALVNLIRHKVTPGAAKGSLGILRDYVQAASLRSGIEGALKAMEAEDLTDASGALHSALKRARSNIAQEAVSAHEGIKDRLAAYTSGKAVGFRFEMPTTAMNDLMGGGFPTSRLLGIAAWTNVGKSAFATGLSWTAAAGSPDVIVGLCTTEEPENERLARIDARMSGIDRMELMKGRLPAADKAQFEFRLTHNKETIKRIHVGEFPPNANVGEILAWAHQLRDEHPNKPLLLVIDCPDHLKPMMKTEGHRLDQSQVWVEMLAIAHSEDLAPISVVATTQVPNKGNQKGWELGDVSESVDKARTADVFFGLVEANQNSSGGKRELKILLRKNRLNLIKRYCIAVDADLGTCEFVETGAYEDGDGDDDDDD